MSFSKCTFTAIFLSIALSSGLAQQRTPADSAAVIIQEVATALQMPSNTPVATLRQQLYSHVHTDYSGECAIATLEEPWKSLRIHLNKAVRLQIWGFQHPDQLSERATGPAQLSWFFNTASTTNRGSQAACEAAVNNGMNNINTRFQQAGFSAGQFVLPSSNGVRINQDWDAGAGGSVDAGVLLFTFLDWIATNYPAQPGSFHLPIGVTHLSNMNGVAAVTAGIECGQTGFNSEDDVFRGAIVTCNNYVTSTNVMAHEVGHSFSLPHNNSPAICPLGSGGNIAGYIMSAGTGNVWHSVSLTDLYTATNWNNGQGNEFPYFNYVPVPIELIRFTAYKKQQVNIVEWATASEMQGQVFEVERSTDGINFSVLTTVTGRGVASYYEIADDSPNIDDWAYYRLKIDDDSGETTYSRIVRLPNKISQGPQITPNPATDCTTLSFSSSPEGTIRLLQMDGRVVMVLPAVELQKSYKLDLSRIDAGVYLIEYQTNSACFLQKLIRQK